MAEKCVDCSVESDEEPNEGAPDYIMTVGALRGILAELDDDDIPIVINVHGTMYHVDDIVMFVKGAGDRRLADALILGKALSLTDLTLHANLRGDHGTTS